MSKNIRYRYVEVEASYMEDPSTPLYSLGAGLRSILFSMMDFHEYIYMVTSEIHSEISWSGKKFLGVLTEKVSLVGKNKFRLLYKQGLVRRNFLKVWFTGTFF